MLKTHEKLSQDLFTKALVAAGQGTLEKAFPEGKKMFLLIVADVPEKGEVGHVSVGTNFCDSHIPDLLKKVEEKINE